MEKTKIIVVAIIIGASLIVSSTVLGDYFYRSHQENETISVIGSATKRHVSDIVKWKVTLERTTDVNDKNTGYFQLQKDMDTVLQLLKTNGVDPQNITIDPIESELKTDRNDKQIGYNLSQCFFIISSDIPKIEKMALHPNFILERNIPLQSSSLEYYFSKLPDIKRELIAEAIQDAKKRAETIAQNSGSAIVKLNNARTGTFEINEPYSTEVRYGGVYNTSTREKDITVTVDATYLIN